MVNLEILTGPFALLTGTLPVRNIKGTEFIMDPSGQTGAQFAWEAEKAAVSVAFPPLGLILAGMDLACVGPSA